MKTRVCAKPGCGRTALNGIKYCEKHKNLQNSAQNRKIFTQRGKSSQYHSLYESPEWRKRRAMFLRKYPFCFICGKPSTIVDHIIPHRGNLTLFWDENNWQPMCQSCHSRKTLKENNNFHQKGDRGAKT